MELFLNACLGSSFVLCARERVRVDGAFPTPLFGMVLMFIGLVLAPMTLYLHLAHGAWSWLYMVDPGTLPALAVVPVLVLQSGALIGTWYLGARLIAAGNPRPVGFIAAACGLVFIVLAILLSGRLAAYGSYEAYQRGATAGLMDVKLGYVLIALILGLIAATSFVAIELVHDSRRVQGR